MDSFSRSQLVRKPAVTAAGGIVAAQHRRAAEAGAAVLAAGGDAVDAAIATSFALGVLEPWMSGIGGGGAMVLYRAREGRAVTIDFGPKAPAALDPAHYPLTGAGVSSDLFPWPAVLEDRNALGASAIAAPGTVEGMRLAHESFGTRPWRELVMPAAELADEGLLVDWYAALLIASSTRLLAANAAAAAVFLEDGRWPTISSWTALQQKRIALDPLARTLRVLAEEGPRAFYEGPLAATIAREVRQAGGFLGELDLAAYRAGLADARSFAYRGATLHPGPALSAGPTLAHALRLLPDSAMRGARPDADAYLAYAEALDAAYRFRLEHMGDTAEALAGPACTSHFSVVDRAGNLCAVTQTLLSIFGAKVLLPESGILMNNGILWFDPEPGKPNSLGAGKRCLMNVSPLIGEAGGRRFALGASGGRRIMPAVMQLASFLVDYGMSLEDAFHQPRIDMSGGEVVIADETLPDAAHERLAARFPHVRGRRAVFPYLFACPAGVLAGETANEGATEIMSPWGDAVAEPPHPTLSPYEGERDAKA